MKAPFSNASGVLEMSKTKVWNNENLNLLLVKLTDINDKSSEVEELSLLNLDIQNKKYSYYTLPVDAAVDYPFSNAKGSIRKSYLEGNKNNKQGLGFLEKTVTKLLAVPIDGFVIVDDKGLNEIESKVGEIGIEKINSILRLKNISNVPIGILAFRNSSMTNLRIDEIVKILWFIKSVPDSSTLVEEVSEQMLSSSEKWDNMWQKRIKINDVKRESIKVFIANASKSPKIPGLAEWGARIVRNIGGSVLETENSFVDFDKNTIIAEDANLETVKQLSKALGLEEITLKADLNKNAGYNSQIFRTKVSVILVAN